METEGLARLLGALRCRLIGLVMALLATAATAGAVPPTAVTDTLETPFVSADINPASNDTDPDGGFVRLIGCGGGSKGSATLVDLGFPVGVVCRYTFTATPLVGVATDNFNYTVQDPQGETAMGTVQVTIRNDAPAQQPDLSFRLVTSDTDFGRIVFRVPYGDSESRSVDITFTGAGIGVPTCTRPTPQSEFAFCAYVPRLGFQGLDVFLGTKTDPFGATSSFQVTFNVHGPLAVASGPRTQKLVVRVQRVRDERGRIPPRGTRLDPQGRGRWATLQTTATVTNPTPGPVRVAVVGFCGRWVLSPESPKVWLRTLGALASNSVMGKIIPSVLPKDRWHDFSPISQPRLSNTPCATFPPTSEPKSFARFGGPLTSTLTSNTITIPAGGSLKVPYSLKLRWIPELRRIQLATVVRELDDSGDNQSVVMSPITTVSFLNRKQR